MTPLRVPRSRRGVGLGCLSLALLLCTCAGPGALPPAPVLDPDLVQHGAFLYRDARLSGDGSRSCETCHPGGGSDWRTYRDGEAVPAGSPGARLTPSIRGVYQTAPYLWDGSVSDLDAVIDRMLAVEMRGATLDERALAALRAYVRSLPPFDRGRVQADGTPVEPTTMSARRGFTVFQEARCTACHPPPAYTRGLRFDMDTGGKFAIPSLRGISAANAFGHDGRWMHLEDAVDAILRAREVELSDVERAQLLAYLQLL